jgi:putative hydrolase of the HAD superfamily
METWPEVEAVPDIKEALEELKGRHIVALATNAAESDEGAIRRALARAHLEPFFRHIFCVANVGSRKPSPAFFERILDLVGTTPHRTIMVGDDFEADVQGALAVGLSAVWFNAGSRRTCVGPRLRTIHHLAELPDAVQALLGT